MLGGQQLVDDCSVSLPLTLFALWTCVSLQCRAATQELACGTVGSVVLKHKICCALCNLIAVQWDSCEHFCTASYACFPAYVTVTCVWEYFKHLCQMLKKQYSTLFIFCKIVLLLFLLFWRHFRCIQTSEQKALISYFLTVFPFWFLATCFPSVLTSPRIWLNYVLIYSTDFFPWNFNFSINYCCIVPFSIL